MERSGFPETVHILSEKEMDSLKEYAEEKKSVSGYGFSRRWEWSVDLSGIWLHTGAEKMTEEVKGEPVSFCSSGSSMKKSPRKFLL